MQILSEPGHVQILGLFFTIVVTVASAINVFVSLRLAALQAVMKEDLAMMQSEMLKQWVAWRDELMGQISGRFVSSGLAAEIHSNIGREINRLEAHLERIEERCASKTCALMPQRPPDT